MERTRNYIYKALYFYGFHQFQRGPTWNSALLYTWRIIFSITNGIFFHFAFFYSVFDPTNKFSDKIYLFTLCFGVLSVDWEYWTVWTRSDVFKELFEWVLALYKERKNRVVEMASRTEYTKLEILSWKCIRYKKKINFIVLFLLKQYF